MIKALLLLLWTIVWEKLLTMVAESVAVIGSTAIGIFLGTWNGLKPYMNKWPALIFSRNR